MKINLDQYSLCGVSISGRFTSICVPELKICFDMGCVPKQSISARVVLITHGHMDHIGALNLHYRQRCLRSITRKPNYVMPSICFKPFKMLHSAYQALDQGLSDTTSISHISEMNLFKTETFMDQPFKLNAQTYIKAYPMKHRVSSFGYIVYESRKKLKPEYCHLSGHEIANLRHEQDLFDIHEKPLIAYTGDTIIQSVLDQPDFLKAETLIMECTHLQDMSSNVTHKYQHIHIEDILTHKDQFQCKNLVLCHFSSIYFDRHPTMIKKLLEDLDFFKKMAPVNVYLFDELPI